MSGVNDLLTATQNAVQAINNVSQTYINVQGARTTADITDPIVLKQLTGRIASISVIVAGSADGAVYDSNTLVTTTKQLFVIPMTVGITVVNMPFSIGLLIVPGTGQQLAVSFS